MRRRVLILVFLFLVPLLLIPASNVVHDPIMNQTSDIAINDISGTTNAKTTVTQRHMFYENRGQVRNSDVLYYGMIPNGKVGFGMNAIYLWTDDSNDFVVMSFEDASDAVPIGMEKLGHLTNFFIGDTSITGVRAFASVVYNDLWNEISLEYRATAAGAKYEFILEPDADPSDIRVKTNGHDTLSKDESGLRIQKGLYTFVDAGLHVFQSDSTVDAELVMHDSQTFGFNLGIYDNSEPLVIDPLLYCTYLGGSNSPSPTPDDFGVSSVIDTSGNIYVTGHTVSTDFSTFNALNSTTNGGVDCFVSKLDSTGTSLLYSTYVGGAGSDYTTDLEVDTSGNVYVTGYTNSGTLPGAEFPLKDEYQSQNNGLDDCFVFRLNATGNGLDFSTYLGGTGNDRAMGIAYSTWVNNPLFLTGETDSTDFPELVNTYAGGSSDCFLVSLNHWEITHDMSVDYCLYYGGSSSETGKDVIVDDSGIYPLLHVTGNTFSSDFPVLNGYDSSFNGVSDCFVLEVVDAPGSPSLSYSTFVGGAGLDLALSIIGDSSGNLYVTGATSSTDFPTTSPAYNTSFSGGTTDVFLFKLGPDGESLLYSSYIGGSLEDMGSSISLDSSGFTYITGTTNSTDFPVTANAMNDTHNGFYDCFLLRMDTSDGSLGYSTFFGGSGLDGGLSISVGTSNNVYVLGVTMSPDLPISSGAFNETYGGGADCFVFRHTETIGPSVSVSQTPLSPSYTDPVTVEVTITDLDSTVVSAAIYYRTSSDGISWSDYTVIVMSNPTPDNYRGIIPVQPYNTQVEYYVFTQDSLLNPTISSAAYTVGDGTAPVVSNVVHDPLSPSVNQQVTVTATTSDNSGSGIQTVEIHYRTRLSADAWSDWTIVSMTSQGGETYAGAIPAQAQTEVQYFVSATDAASNEGTSTTLSYIVGPDLLETLLLVGEIGALIGLFGGGAVWIWRRMKKRGSEEPTTGVEK